MSVLQKINEKIKRKEQEILEYEREILEFEAKIREAKAYIQAMNDSIKLLPGEERVKGSPEKALRPGTDLAKTYELLKRAGKPMHISEIIQGIGKPVTKANKVSLSGSLGWYVRRHEIFDRPSPNTFALVGMGVTASSEPPEDFGLNPGTNEGSDDTINVPF